MRKAKTILSAAALAIGLLLVAPVTASADGFGHRGGFHGRGSFRGGHSTFFHDGRGRSFAGFPHRGFVRRGFGAPLRFHAPFRGFRFVRRWVLYPFPHWGYVRVAVPAPVYDPYCGY